MPPLYEYECEKCKEKVSLLRPIANRDSPFLFHDHENGGGKCGASCNGRLTRIEISLPSPVHPSAANWRRK